jgi:hypothetical protein
MVRPRTAGTGGDAGRRSHPPRTLPSGVRSGRRGRVAVTAALLLAPLLAATPGAAAAPAGAVSLPQPDDPALGSVVQLLGASDSRVLVRATAWNGVRILSGASSLASVPAVATGSTRQYPALVGDTVVWPATVGGIAKVLRRNLSTDVETSEDANGDALWAAGPAGWYGTSGQDVVLRSGATRRVLLTNVATLGAVASDATHALISYKPAGSTSAQWTLALVTLDDATATTLTTGLEHATGQALSAGYAVWVAGSTVVRRDRTTGTQTVRVLAVPGEAVHLAATDHATAYSSTTSLHVVPAAPGSPEVTVSAVAPVRSVQARATGFVVSKDGAPATGGVWTVTDAGVATKTLPAPAVGERLSWLTLDGGRVAYAGGTSRGPNAVPLGRLRDVTGDVALAAGEESTLPSEPAGPALSGARGAVRAVGPPATVRLTDRGAAMASLPGSTATLSGPYAVVGGLPHRSDGSRVALPVADGVPVAADVFGSRVGYVTKAGAVRLLNALLPLSTTNPRTLGTGACTGACAPLVRVAADTVGWRTAAGGVVRDVRAGAQRTVAGLLDVGDGVAVRAASGALEAIDLSTSSAPVALGTYVAGQTLVAVDDHRVAWTEPSGAVTVAPLPFGAAHRPRVLGVVAPPAFSPNGDVAQDLWLPLVDASKPLSGAFLSIRRGAASVLTLVGSGPTGSVRDLMWDGRDRNRARVADGTYTWTLVGRAADGDGALAAIDGTSAVTGTVVVDRLAESATAAAPATSALATTGTGVPVRWAVRGVPSLSAVRFDVRTRTADWDGARRALVPGAVTSLRTGTSSLSALVPAPASPRGRHVQVSVRARDVAGNTGPWSAWVTAESSTDDRAMTRVGTWAREASGGSYRGTTSSTVDRRAVLRATVAGSKIYVVGTRCPTCGVMRVSVDGGPYVAVDTRASVAKRRVLLHSRSVVAGVHTVSVSTAATPGRPRVYLDALGAGF